ncbi:Glycosyl hydrolase family 30 beta sandwich domain, partial [Trinorchestia longiramus]
QDINYYSVGWVDWNQALNMIGGPLFLGNALDAPIIVNEGADEFYQQPTFFALTHVSKFFKRGDLRIDAIPSDNSVKSAAVLKEDGTVAVVVLNTGEEDTAITISVDGSRFINTDILAKSFNSFLVPP